ncbi:MAG: hypothetical protein K2M07_08370 [Muribaculaceae bacterium]|nr:hypothetical protein [Muribaculaceae bacterium]
MNEFEKQMNALRLQYKAEQRSITKDANRTIGRLNAAIRMVDSQEAREALRAEKERVYESMRRSHALNKACYSEQMEMLNDKLRLHFEKTPSKRRLRRIIGLLCRQAEADGQKSFVISFGESRRAEITFD